VKVTEQLLWSVVAGTAARVQEGGLKVPDLELVKLTVPGGLTRFPGALEVSLTVAVQVVGLSTVTGLGLQLTVVAVE
jgi:hypothetical protein